LPVGLNVNGKNVLQSTNVRGKEDGEKAVDFDLWLVSWEDVKTALKLKLDEPVNGQIEIKTSLIKFKLDANKLIKDPVLGTAIVIKDLNTIPGITAKFDINKYAIDIAAPTIDRPQTGDNIVDRPPDLDGLPVARTGNLTMGAVQQRIVNAGQNGQSGTTQGDFKAIGSVFDASWFVRIQQPQIDGVQTWSLDEVTILRQRPQSDIAIGYQIPFWNRQGSGSGSFWGATGIFRNGFTPPVELSGGELFWQPSQVSLQVSAAVSTGDRVDFLGKLNYTPSQNFYLTANSDRFSSRADANWRLTPSLTSFSSVDTSRGVSIGSQYTTTDAIASTSTSLRGDIDSQLRLRLAATQRLQNWQFGVQLNESAISSQASYQLNPKSNSGSSDITASYQTSGGAGTTGSSSFTSLVWRY
jgi:hypothetical protein